METTIAADLKAKESALKDKIAAYGSLAVAYSGGVDSTYLSDVAHEVLGGKAVMVLFDSPSLAHAQLDAAKAVAQERGWNFSVMETTEFEIEAFLNNDRMRCYYCKREKFTLLTQYAQTHGYKFVAHGENADDSADEGRVGMRAAQESDAVAPLAEVGLGKEAIRELSQRRGLPTWDKESDSCLATRIPSGTSIHPEDMGLVEQAEGQLRKLGFRRFRARHHGDLCRIQLAPEDFRRVLEPAMRAQIEDAIQAVGYRFVALDLRAYKPSGAA